MIFVLGEGVDGVFFFGGWGFDVEGVEIFVGGGDIIDVEEEVEDYGVDCFVEVGGGVFKEFIDGCEGVEFNVVKFVDEFFGKFFL